MSKFLPSFAPPVNTTPAWQVAPSNGTAGIKLLPATGTNSPWVWLLGFYALTLTVPIAEILIVYLHAHIPVAVIADAFLSIGLIMTGRIGAFMEAPMAKAWVALLVMFSVAAAFGQYPGLSVPFIFQYGIRFHVFPFYCCAVAASAKNVRHTLSWVAWGSFVLLFLCRAYGHMGDGRLLIPDTDLANPNDLGMALLFAMSGLVVFKSVILRVLTIAALPLLLYETLLTGSRACLVTVMALTVILFLAIPTKSKVAMALLIPIIGAILVAVMPSFTLARLVLIVADPDKVQTSDDQLRGALDSQAERTELQRQAIELTVRHPIFGVGPLMFMDAVEGMVRQTTGHRSGWLGAHNTYLEIAAEDGIPALLFYTWSLWVCMKLNYSAYKLCRARPRWKDWAAQSLSLILMTVAFAVCTFFSNNAYDTRVCVLVGISAANFLALKREMQEVPEQQPSAPPVVTAGFVRSRNA